MIPFFRNLLLCLIFSIGFSFAQKANTLTVKERNDGWELLFDGRTTDGWRGAYSAGFPQQGWVVKDGELRGEHINGAEAKDAGDIVTGKKYKDFVLVFDWKLGKGGNSGVKYFIEERLPKPQVGSQSGYEYQLIDDANYIYMEKKLPDDLKTASIYDVVAAKKPDSKTGMWHISKIVVQGETINTGLTE